VARLNLAISAVAFDLDGTLLDTLPDIAAAADAMLIDVGHEPAGEPVVRGYIGNGLGRLTKRLLTGRMDGEPSPEMFERAYESLKRHYQATLSRRTRPYPGVETGLQRFKQAGLKLACITNKAEAFTVPLLQATGLSGFFDLVLSGDSLPRRKPDPLPLLHCARQFGVSPAEMLIIGDSANDTQAARAAGCPVFCVPYGYRSGEMRDLDCDAIVRDLIEASELITSIHQ
jgi:phosphoglycolate phosphatase